jgi:hypothetical protein
MDGVTEQQLRNLEGIGATRTTDPLNVRLGTALAILRTYYGDVTLDDFVGARTGFALKRTRRPSKAAPTRARGAAGG